MSPMVNTINLNNIPKELIATLPDEDLRRLGKVQALASINPNALKRRERFINSYFVDGFVHSAEVQKLVAKQAAETVTAAKVATTAASSASAVSRFFSKYSGIGLTYLNMSIIDKATEKSKTLTEFKEKHPFAKAVTDLAVATALLPASKKVAKGLTTILSNSIPKPVKKYAQDFVANLTRQIKDTSFVKNIVKPGYENALKFISSHPHLDKVLKASKRNALPIIVGLSFLKGFILPAVTLGIKSNSNYKKLKESKNEVLANQYEDYRNNRAANAINQQQSYASMFPLQNDLSSKINPQETADIIEAPVEVSPADEILSPAIEQEEIASIEPDVVAEVDEQIAEPEAEAFDAELSEQAPIDSESDYLEE